MLPSGAKRRLRYPTDALTKNTSPSFVGLEGLKKTQLSGPREDHHGLGCLQSFEAWAASGAWDNFSPSKHFDWWVFPIDEASSYGYQYAVFKDDIEELLRDPDWVKNHRRGIELIARAWGWDIQRAQPVSSPQPNQRYHNYPVRFYKCALSAWLFGYKDYFASLRLLALHLLCTNGDRALDDYIIELFSITPAERLQHTS